MEHDWKLLYDGSTMAGDLKVWKCNKCLIQYDMFTDKLGHISLSKIEKDCNDQLMINIHGT